MYNLCVLHRATHYECPDLPSSTNTNRLYISQPEFSLPWLLFSKSKESVAMITLLSSKWILLMVLKTNDSHKFYKESLYNLFILVSWSHLAVGKGYELWNQTNWVQIPNLFLANWVTWDKLLNFPKSQFPHLLGKDNADLIKPEQHSYGRNKRTVYKMLNTVPDHNRCLIKWVHSPAIENKLISGWNSQFIGPM